MLNSISSYHAGIDWLSEDIVETIDSITSLAGAVSSVEYQPLQDNGFFIYQLDQLAKHVSALNMQDTVKLWFAVKANPLSAVIETLAKQGLNFDVASPGELTQVLGQNVNAANILNTGPAKSKQQLMTFLSKGVRTFVIESMHQLTWLNEAAHLMECRPQVLLRVQLQWPEGEKNPLGGNSLTPFGLSCEIWQALKLDDFPNLNINGLHIFQWGNMLSNEQMFSLWSQMVEPLTALAEHIGMSFEVLDLGGGLGIDYLQQGQQLNWQQSLADLATIKARAGVAELWLELGRFAVAQCGYYVTTVVDRKTNYGQQQLILAGGINHLLRPALTEQPFPVALARPSVEHEYFFDVHGPLCTSLDKLGHLALPADTDVGDQLIFGLTGAYGFSESMPFFLCHDIAAEYVVQQGQLTQVREPQAASWYLR